MLCRSILCWIVLLCGSFAPFCAAGESLDPKLGMLDEQASVVWYDIRHLDVEGQGFRDTKAPFDRLPASAEEKVRSAVWGLSRHSAGLCVRFVTDAPRILARWTLTSANLAMTHMPATGVSGLDLYARTDDGQWRWLAVGRPSAQATTAQLVSGLPAGEREYLLYLPLYNGVSSVEVGIPQENKLAKGPARPAEQAKPLVFYGTSITQGGCASRPGMVHTAIIGRRLECPVINLGFSGNGKMEVEVAEFMAQIDASVFIVDCLPNISASEVTSNTESVVQTLRKAHPQTPILLVEDRSYTSSFLLSSQRERNETSRAALQEVYAKLKADGVSGLYYLEGEKLLGEDGEDTVDGSHPTDLGFMRHAEAFLDVLQPIVGRRGDSE